jgi:hypothetical protein
VAKTTQAVVFFLVLAAIAFLVWRSCLFYGGSAGFCLELIR